MSERNPLLLLDDLCGESGVSYMQKSAWCAIYIGAGRYEHAISIHGIRSVGSAMEFDVGQLLQSSKVEEINCIEGSFVNSIQ